MMNEQHDNEQHDTEARQEQKGQAGQDYESGREFLENGDLARAANAFHNALVGYEREDDEKGVANAADKLGDICVERGEIETALKHYDRAYAICEKHQDRFSLFSLDKKKAKLMLDAKEYDKAIAMYLDILDEYGALRNPQGSVNTLETLAGIYLGRGDGKRAADCYRTAAAIHRSFNHARQAEMFMQKAAGAEKK